MSQKKYGDGFFINLSIPSSNSHNFQVAFEGEKMILVGGSRDRWVVLAEAQDFANFHENILSFQVTPGSDYIGS